MTISFKARVPKVTEDDILFSTPFDPMKDAWVWREKGIRADDIVEIIAISKDMCYVVHFDYFNFEGGYKKTVVKEAFQDAIVKWEIALTSNAIFEDVDEHETKEEGQDSSENGSSGEDDED